MDILIVNVSLNRGGVEKQILHLVKYYRKSEVMKKIDIILLSEEGAWVLEARKFVTVYSLSKKIPSNCFLKLIWPISLIFKLKKFLSQKDYDIILTFLWLPTLITICSKPKKVPVVWSVQSDLEESMKIHLDRKIREFLIKKFIVNNVDYFLPVSSGIKRKLVNWLNVPFEKVKLIPNSVDLEEIVIKAKTRDERIPPKKKRFRILAVGRFHIAKGMDIFLRSISLLPPDLKEQIEVYIIGDGPERLNLERLRAGVGLTETVNFLGFRDNPYVWMASADIFVSPSRWETFGIVIVEAMALGLPVIATATDGAKDLIIPNQTGLLVPVNDERGLAEAMEYLLTNKELRHYFTQFAKKRAKDFAIQRILKKYEKVLEKIVSQKGEC